jgi:hypothetical protein
MQRVDTKFHLTFLQEYEFNAQNVANTIWGFGVLCVEPEMQLLDALRYVFKKSPVTPAKEA